VELNIEPGQSLGLMIRGGVEYNLGIFITGVDKDSVADRAGLMVSVTQYLLLTFRYTYTIIIIVEENRITFLQNLETACV
jgi:hypothetical protein